MSSPNSAQRISRCEKQDARMSASSSAKTGRSLSRSCKAAKGRGYIRAVFTVEERDRVRARLLAFAAEEQDVVGAAITGPLRGRGQRRVVGHDLAFAIRGASNRLRGPS